MIKKFLLSLVVAVSIFSAKGVYAAEEEPIVEPTCSLEYQEPQIEDASAIEQYELKENTQISTQNYTSDIEVYAEIEKRVKNAILNGENRVNLYDMNVSNTKYFVCSIFRYYSPYFFQGLNVNVYMRYYEDNRLAYVSIENPWTIERTKQYFSKVDERLAFYKSLVNDSMSQMQKALVIHDYIVSHSEYDLTYSRYDCGGIFMDGTGVCQSYSMAYMYILHSLGIECHYAASSDMNHAWNIVKIDGKNYHVDCTWDDPINDRFGLARHKYFLLSDSAISNLNHYGWDADGRTCTSDIYDDAFWKEVDSPIVFLNNNYYYVKRNASDDEFLIKRGNSTNSEITLAEVSKRRTSSYYNHTGLFYYDGSLYYNSNNQLKRYCLADGLEYLVYELDSSLGYIRGCRLNDDNIIEYAVSNNSILTGDRYVFISENGWKNLKDNWYYIKDKKILKSQWIEVDGFKYYLDELGRRLENDIWVLKGEDGKTAAYLFGEDGKLQCKVVGWYTKGENTYYYSDDGQKYKGIKEIEGEWYYFADDGKMMRNSEITGDDLVLYYFGKDGKLEWKLDVSSDGWKQIGDSWYYVQNQCILKSSWISEDEFTYYVNDAGKRLENEVLEVNDGGKIYEYRFDKEGHLVIGWYEEGEDRYYYYVAGQKCRGLWHLENESYYFDDDGKMVRNTEIIYKEILYYFGDDGKQQYQSSDLSDGWKQINNVLYYLKDQHILRSQWLTLGDAVYYLNETGKMLANEDCLLTDFDGENSHVYHFGPGGAMVTGWYQTNNGEWTYLDKNGLPVTGWINLNNVWYYLNEANCMVTGWNTINGAWYYFDASGSMHTGWLQLNGVWYYMMPSGAMATGWNAVENYWYYFNANGSMHIGWLNLNGIWYCMMPSGAMATGWESIGNIWYYFDGSGSMVVGWLQLGNTWYYLQESGSMVTGWQIIDGGNYYFNESGAWVN